MSKKILVLGGGDYLNLFAEHGDVTINIDELQECDLVVFTGGSDVSPAMYGEQRGMYTMFDPRRDVKEAHIFHTAAELGIPMAGICRGSQFLTVMNGGRLFQHVENHGLSGMHGIKTKDGEYYEVTSTHHQMMNPWPIGEDNFAWSDEVRSDVYMDGLNEDCQPPIVEPEVVWYPKTRSLAAQFHPEYMPRDSKGYHYYQQLVREYLL
jgi:gamma-glutamyl-gamma-aminobutyrate hydrolase PuuD